MKIKTHRRTKRNYHLVRVSDKVWKQLQAKEVTHIRFYGVNSTGYCVCPGCSITFEREYQNFCDRCGQKLSWNAFSNGKVILIKRISAKPKETKSETTDLVSV